MKKMGFGMMRLPLTNKEDPTKIDQKQVNKMVDAFMENGYTYFDTAYPYHNGASEVALKKAVVERYPRDSFVIADKLPIFALTKKEDMEPIFNEQLKRCGVDYFDYYLVHNVSRASEKGFVDIDSFEFVEQKKAEGKVKNIGFSLHDDAEYMEKVLENHPDIDFVQLQLNYLDWESPQIESRKIYEVAKKYDIPVVVMEALKGGFLANIPEEADELIKEYDYNTDKIELALKFLANLDNVFMILSGASTIEQMNENINYMENMTPMKDEEYTLLEQVSKIIQNDITVSCTQCKYCVEECPVKINIPEIFDLYNKEKKLEYQGYTAIGNYIINYAKEGHPMASACIECGACIPKCPQHIDIPTVMKYAKTTIEKPLYGF
ncbi:aldo/keto reductase [Methanosphaera sp. WGK6]|uniref:aldo/keto reductase n=1 Tax=Methanosphaera sp. WGK6 TaxID=1561964 RepID=UPI00084C0C7F|nr:aldo/keto reductase [Methanosphaera sp. WGK6]OED30019.1 Fe-S oxidoreductase [Methanosphaera sp. WGK6]